MIFDHRYTWKPHIHYLVAKARRRLGLLRMIAGQTWGANSKTLLIIYKAFIRSVLLWGTTAYGSACQAHIHLLESIQYQALKICMGVAQGTESSALKVHCGEPPINLQILQTQLSTFIKARHFPSAGSEATLDHWSLTYGSFQANFKLFFKNHYHL